MLEKARFILFRAPMKRKDIEKPAHSTRKAKIRIGKTTREVVEKVCFYNGITHTTDSDFSLFWGTSAESDELHLKSFLQKINHFPNSLHILGDKSSLADLIQESPQFKEGVEGFDFFPLSFVLPRDNKKLYDHMKNNKNAVFICKPPLGSCGKGIALVNYEKYYAIRPGSVVSKFIERPLLIDDFKFDLRIYVLVTSYSPLSAFIYQEGITRFATGAYAVADADSLDPSAATTTALLNPESHLYSVITNITLNKRGMKYTSAFKWSLLEVLQEMENRWGYKKEDSMNKITDIVAKTLSIVQPRMAPEEPQFYPKNKNFELYGFDILVDADFRMWLLEINTMPFLGLDDKRDFSVKSPLIAQTLTIVGILDLSTDEMCAAQEEFDLDGFSKEEAFKYQIKCEDDRNRISGGKFKRLFPSPQTAHLEKYLISPFAKK